MVDFQIPMNGMQRALQSVQEASEDLAKPPLMPGQPRFGNLGQAQTDQFSASVPLQTQPHHTLVSNILKLNMAKLFFDANLAVFGMFKRIWDEILNLMNPSQGH